jgi:hypothetical protein
VIYNESLKAIAFSRQCSMPDSGSRCQTAPCSPGEALVYVVAPVTFCRCSLDREPSVRVVCVRISTQAPPNGEQIGGSNPIYFSLLDPRDDGEVFGCGLDFSMRKTELCLSTSDQVGHTSRSVLQIVENVAANQSAMGKTTHDSESLLSVQFFSWTSRSFSPKRVAPLLLESERLRPS